MILTPITPNESTRYHSKQPTSVGHMAIPGVLGSHTAEAGSAPDYLPPQWNTHVHPEGQRYFYRKSEASAELDINIVTEANLYNSDTMKQVSSIIKFVEDKLSSSRANLSNDAELFIQFNGDGCEYYFVNHGLRNLFWLEDVDTEVLGLSAVASPSHLERCLTSMYWSHVEYFPMHRNVIDRPFVDELIAILLHGHLDVLTSSTSTFPYSAEKCNNLATILRNSRDQNSDGHVVWMAARVASLIHGHRFSTHYGESIARLGLDQSLFPEPTFDDSLSSRLVSRLTFSTSAYYMSQLNSLFVDRVVYAREWKAFWAQTLKEWKNILNLSIAFLLLHLLFGYVQRGLMPSLTVVSATCIGLSTISSVVLTLQHETKDSDKSAGGYNYLEHNRSDTTGFLFLACQYAFPKTALVWGLSFFIMNWISVLVTYISCNLLSQTSVVAVAFVALASLAIVTGRILRRKLRGSRDKTEAPFNIV